MTRIEPILEVAFWVCAIIPVYAYLGYPLAIWWIARSRKPPTVAAASENLELPTVSVLIAAHNEEAVIEERIQNALALDYPSEKLEIVIASDGSRDRTAEIVQRFTHRSVKLQHYPQNRGKASVLNETVPLLR